MCKELDPTRSSSIFGGGARFFEAGESLYEDLSGKTAADAAKDAANKAAAGQQAGLDYLKETEEIPQALRQAGLQQLGGIAGLPGFEEFGSQQQLIDRAQASPFFQSQLETGREATARLGSGQGGFRGGSTASDIVGYEQNLLNQAYQQQLGGIQNLAQLPSAAPQIAQQYGQIGQTQAQGITAGAQAQQQGFGNMLKLGGQIGSAYLMSDVRLKDNIVKTGGTSHPDIHKYTWDWKQESGKTGSDSGYLAQEVEKVWPDYVIEGDDGYKRILKSDIEERLNA